MQKEDKTRDVARSTGASYKKRRNQQASRCQGFQHETHSEAIIANSIFTLKLESKKGIEVVFKQAEHCVTGNKGEGDDYVKMYEDLLLCINNGLTLLGFEDELCNNLHAIGLPLHQAINHLFIVLESKIVPSGFEYNIDREYEDSGDYFITIFKICDSGDLWHTFEIKYVLEHLKSTNQELYDLYVQFIISFHHETQIDFWFGDTMCYCEEWLSERIEELKTHFSDEFNSEIPDDDSDESMEYKDAVETFNEYNYGKAKYFESIAKSTNELMSVLEILLALEEIKEDNPIKEVIKLGCALMEQPYNIWHYKYDPSLDSEDIALEFEMQYAITWDTQDTYSAYQRDMINATAREGVHSACLHKILSPTTKKFDHGWLKNGIEWPNQLTRYWLDIQDLIESYNPIKYSDNE